MKVFGFDLNNPTNVLILLVIMFLTWKLTAGFSMSSAMSNAKKSIVLFHLPNCGFCKDMMPEWDKFQENHQDDENVEVKKIDGSVDAETARAHGVTGFPTIIKFSGNGKEIFQGERTAEALEGFLQK